MSQSKVQKYFKQIFKHSTIKFASVGIINTLLSIAIIFTLKYFANASDVLSNAFGYLSGLTCSFILNKSWTFEHSETTWSALPKFLLVFGVSYLINIFTVLIFIKMGVNDYYAQLTGIPLYSITFYFGSKYFAFSRPYKNNNLCK